MNSSAHRIIIVQDLPAFEALGETWRAIDGGASVRPFQQHAWIAAWARTLGARAETRLKIAVLWRGERIAAALPLCVRRYRGVRILEWAAARVSDYCDALLDPAEDAASSLRLLWEAVRKSGGFDLARLSHVRTDTHLFAFLHALDPWTETREDAGGVSITWKSGDEWLRAQPAGFRDRVKYNARRMSGAGFAVRVCDSPQQCARIIDTLIAQKRPWLAQRNLTSFIDEPGGVEFLHAVVAAAVRRGELHLSTVENGEHIGACDLAFVHDGVIYSYLASFDPQYRKYSFGRVLTDNLFMWACDNGIRRLDLLLGAYDYKTEYGCTLEPVRTLVLPQGMLGRGALLLYRRLKNGKSSPDNR